MEHDGIKNIIFIVIDALRAENLGCYGYPIETSPNIDEYAKKSILFKNAYACCANTDPAFTSIVSGLYPPSHGIVNHANRIKPEEMNRIGAIPFMAEILHSHGYKTYGLDFLGRWHRRGFDYYIGTEKSPKQRRVKVIDLIRKILRIDPGSKVQGLLEKTPIYELILSMLFHNGSTPYWPADKLVDFALEILEKNRDEKKFLFLHFWDPHKPYWPPEYYLKDIPVEMYGDLYFDADKPLREIEDTICSPLSRFFFRQMSKGKERAADLIQNYDGEVRFVDDHLGRLLKRLGDDCMVVIMADHGESLTEHGIFFTHEGLYRQVLHIPLILRLPGMTPKVLNSYAQSVDLLPTMVELLGIEICSHVDGVSLLPSIENDEAVRNECFAIGSSPVRKGATLFTEDYKYIKALGDGEDTCEYCGKVHQVYEELYDLKMDTNENRNLIHAKPEDAKKYRLKIEQLISGQLTGDPAEPVKVSWSDKEEAEVQRRLEDLGYL